jgi:hypothetical protein
VNEDFIDLIRQINKIRKQNGLKPISSNKITKHLSIKIKRSNVIYNEIISLR